jgi:hypothetical protein
MLASSSPPVVTAPPPKPISRWRIRRRGRVLAVKWGYNPNSSSLGIDVTFLLFGLFAITLLVPIVGLFLRWQVRRRASG